MSLWTHKILEKIDAEKITKEWLEVWKPNLTFHTHGTGPYQYIDGVPCYMRYHGAKSEEEKRKILESTRQGQGLIEKYAPRGRKAVVGEVVNYREYNDDTYLDKILSKNKILNWPSILTISPQSCYGFHIDFINTIHIPLETNDNCFLMMKGFFDNIKVIRLDVGYVYELNTKQHVHTFMNGGETERFHLVGSYLGEEGYQEADVT